MHQRAKCQRFFGERVQFNFKKNHASLNPQILKLRPERALRSAGRWLTNGSFRKLGVPYFGVLIIRILLFRELY